jgi:hypothetical protein
MTTSTLRVFEGARSRASFAATFVVFLLAAPAVQAGQVVPTPEATAASPPDAAAAPASADVPGSKPSLERRTESFEPGRFNQSFDGGLGLMRAASPYALLPGESAAGFSVLNYDRNPGDTDFFQYSFQAAVGIPGGLELFLRASPVFRTNSVNLDPVGYPIPPLDLVLDTYPTGAVRQQPYFLFAQEAPYKSYYVNAVTIDPPGHGAFGTSSGHVLFGAKLNLLPSREGRFGVGVRGYVEVPTEEPSYNVDNWRYVAGTSGATNIGGDLLLGRRIRRVEVLANVGYKHVGDPEYGLRVQLVDSSKWGTPGFLVGAPVETSLDLRDQLSVNGGVSLRAFSINGMQFWGLAEIGYLRYIGGGTPVERLVHPGEIRLGIQANVPKFRRVAIGAAWQLLINDGGHGTTRQSNFQTPDGRGDINFTPQVDEQLAATVESALASQGATFRERSSRVFATDNPAFDQWRNVPAGDSGVVSMGGGNILAFITWRIN